MEVVVKVGPAAIDKLLADAREDRVMVWWLKEGHQLIIGNPSADPLIIYQETESFTGETK